MSAINAIAVRKTSIVSCCDSGSLLRLLRIQASTRDKQAALPALSVDMPQENSLVSYNTSRSVAFLIGPASHARRCGVGLEPWHAMTSARPAVVTPGEESGRPCLSYLVLSGKSCQEIIKVYETRVHLKVRSTQRETSKSIQAMSQLSASSSIVALIVVDLRTYVGT